MVSRKEWYARVNSVWPADPQPPSPAEAVRAAKRLWRWGIGQTWKGEVKVTSGNRYTWIRRGVLHVNPESWDRLVHDMSHLVWRRNNPGEKPHDKYHARLELAMRKEVLKRGWFDGRLKDKPKPDKPELDPKVEKYRRIVDRMDRWIAKKKRAERAIAKLSRSKKYYERTGISM